MPQADVDVATDCTASQKGMEPTPLGTMPATAALAGLPHTRDTPGTLILGEVAAPLASNLLNMLPLACLQLQLPSAGTCIRDGMPPVPAKLAAKICRWEFIEMAELLPEFWNTPKGGDPRGRREESGRVGW